jgi:hypothetical protein
MMRMQQIRLVQGFALAFVNGAGIAETELVEAAGVDGKAPALVGMGQDDGVAVALHLDPVDGAGGAVEELRRLVGAVKQNTIPLPELQTPAIGPDLLEACHAAMPNLDILNGAVKGVHLTVRVREDEAVASFRDGVLFPCLDQFGADGIKVVGKMDLPAAVERFQPLPEPPLGKGARRVPGPVLLLPAHVAQLGRAEAFVADYNHRIDNLTPADVYFGRGQTILVEREGSNDRPLPTAACSTSCMPPDITKPMSQSLS